MIPHLADRAVRYVGNTVIISLFSRHKEYVCHGRHIAYLIYVCRVRHPEPVDIERVRIELGGQRFRGGIAPQPLLVFGHQRTLGRLKIAVDVHRIGLRRKEAERHRPVGVNLRRLEHGHAPQRLLAAHRQPRQGHT